MQPFNTITHWLGEQRTMKAANIRALIGDRPRNTGLVKVAAGEIVLACNQVKDPSHIVKALLQGASAHPAGRIVLQQACDLHHLADTLESQEIAEAKVVQTAERP